MVTGAIFRQVESLKPDKGQPARVFNTFKAQAGCTLPKPPQV